MLLWLSCLFSFYRTRKETVHSEYQKVDIAHVYWCIQYDAFEVFTGTADLFVFSLLINFFSFFFSLFFFSFFFSSFFSLGAAIGYLMQIFFISLHFLYDKELLLPSSVQSAFKRLSVLFVLVAGLFYKN